MLFHDTVRPRLSVPPLSRSLVIQQKIVGYRFTAYAMHTCSMCVQLSGSLAYPGIFVENGCVRLSEVWLNSFYALPYLAADRWNSLPPGCRQAASFETFSGIFHDHLGYPLAIHNVCGVCLGETTDATT